MSADDGAWDRGVSDRTKGLRTMSDYEYVDSNWCPDCGEPLEVCRCELDGTDWLADDEVDDDPSTEYCTSDSHEGYEWSNEIEWYICGECGLWVHDDHFLEGGKYYVACE